MRGWVGIIYLALFVAVSLRAEQPLRHLGPEECRALLARCAQNSALEDAQNQSALLLRRRLIERYRKDPFALNIASQIEKLNQFDFEDRSNLFSGSIWFRMVAPEKEGEPYHLVIGVPVIAKLDSKTGKAIDLGTRTEPSATPIKFMAGVMMGIERIERNQQSLDPTKRKNRFKIFQDVTVIAQSVVNQNLARDLSRLGFAHPEKGRLTDSQIQSVVSTAPPKTDAEDPDSIAVEEGVNSLTLALRLPFARR